jgi:hypothetical protein
MGTAVPDVAAAEDAERPLTRDPFAQRVRVELLAPGESDWFRDHWRELERAFRDEPQRALAGADALAALVLERLAESFEAERERAGDLARYRMLFERVLVT